MAGNGGRNRHGGAHQMRTPAAPLPALEIAVRGRRATLPRLEPVGVHRKTHRAARLAPLESGGEEYLVEPFGLRLLLHQPRTRDDHRADMRRDLAAFLQLGFDDL